MDGRDEEAEQVDRSIEEHVKDATDRNELPEPRDEIELAAARVAPASARSRRTTVRQVPEALDPRRSR